MREREREIKEWEVTGVGSNEHVIPIQGSSQWEHWKRERLWWSWKNLIPGSRGKGMGKVHFQYSYRMVLTSQVGYWLYIWPRNRVRLQKNQESRKKALCPNSVWKPAIEGLAISSIYFPMKLPNGLWSLCMKKSPIEINESLGDQPTQNFVWAEELVWGWPTKI